MPCARWTAPTGCSATPWTPPTPPRRVYGRVDGEDPIYELGLAAYETNADTNEWTDKDYVLKSSTSPYYFKVADFAVKELVEAKREKVVKGAEGKKEEKAAGAGTTVAPEKTGEAAGAAAKAPATTPAVSGPVAGAETPAQTPGTPMAAPPTPQK